MDKEPLKEQGSGATPERLHEESHIHTSSAVIGGLALLAFLGVSALAMFGHYIFLRKQSDKTPRRGVIPAVSLKAMPAPELLADPATEYQRVMREQEPLLTGYGWVDEQRAIVRIPVERAMDVIAEQGMAAPGPWNDPLFQATPGAAQPVEPRGQPTTADGSRDSIESQRRGAMTGEPPEAAPASPPRTAPDTPTPTPRGDAR